MNALLPDMLEIEQLDFTPNIPCEHSQHPSGTFGHKGPAYYFVRCLSPCGCPPPADTFYICKSGYHDPSPIRCELCGKTYATAQVWHIIAKVGS